jgi:hypothetical protein
MQVYGVKIQETPIFAFLNLLVSIPLLILIIEVMTLQIFVTNLGWNIIIDYVTHDQPVLLKLCNSVEIVYFGRGQNFVHFFKISFSEQETPGPHNGPTMT